MSATFDDVRINGSLVVGNGWNNVSPNIPRSALLQDDLAEYAIPLTEFRVWDTGALLPVAGVDDDLAFITGTFATNSPTIQTGDLKAVGAATTRYARAMIRLPAEYVGGQTVVLRFHAGMKTTVGDQTPGGTLDCEVFKSDEQEGISADLASAAVDDNINSLVRSDVDFAITEATLSPGDMLDVRVAVTVDDNASGTDVIGMIGSVTLLCDVKG
jgi:hypothetical protein